MNNEAITLISLICGSVILGLANFIRRMRIKKISCCCNAVEIHRQVSDRNQNNNETENETKN